MHLLCGLNGQSLVEFALVLPLLLLILLGAVEIGRAAYYSIAVSNAARAAVQYGAQNINTAADNNFIIQSALDDAPMLSSADVDISTFCECPDFTRASSCLSAESECGPLYYTYLQVDTEMNLTPLIGFPGLPPSFLLQGQARMRVGY